MTDKEYAEYEQTVAGFIDRNKLDFLSTSCSELGNPTEDGEPWFSWHPCECCGSHLGGNREYLHARDGNDELVEFVICEDCAYYVNYGRLDDLTMMKVQQSADGRNQ